MFTSFNRFDRAITTWLAQNGMTLLRLSLGVVFFWFGILKFFPGMSPANDLASRTIDVLTAGLIQPDVAVPLLATWEVLIGLGLISGLFMRATLALLLVQMLGTLTPLVLFPSETWRWFPISPTLEGQYIIKNLVLISSALVIGATVRGGTLVADPRLAKQAAHAEGRQ
jgi:uncharacterized membrane protein YphA (DoxX/SURF4 family)